ncbi:MAG: CPBP family intramembrane metalloprotease [Verrucomicrobia bacterium]|nr:CPBP family intramembrane metalloprotease [Verrucomicrobiota bacterium]
MQQTPKFPGIGQAILLIVGALVLIIGIAVPVALVGLALKLKLVEHPAVMGGINLGALGIAIALGAFLARSPLREVFPFAPVRLALVVPMLLSVLGAVILLSEADNCVRYFWRPPEWLANLFGDLTNAKTSFWGSLFTLVLVAPVTEELLFRGVILHGFLSRYTVKTSVVVSAILFGLMHLNPWQLTSGIGLGLLLGWWLVRTHSLLPCLAGHALLNSMPLTNPLLPFRIPGFNTEAPVSNIV